MLDCHTSWYEMFSRWLDFFLILFVTSDLFAGLIDKVRERTLTVQGKWHWLKVWDRLGIEPVTLRTERVVRPKTMLLPSEPRACSNVSCPKPKNCIICKTYLYFTAFARRYICLFTNNSCSFWVQISYVHVNCYLYLFS